MASETTEKILTFFLKASTFPPEHLESLIEKSGVEKFISIAKRVFDLKTDKYLWSNNLFDFYLVRRDLPFNSPVRSARNGDLDGDSIKEVVILTYDNYLIVLKRGTILARKKFKKLIEEIQIYDLNDDGKDEIIIGFRNGDIKIFGFNKKFYELGTFSTGEKLLSVDVADYNSDGSIEIIAGGRNVRVFKISLIPFKAHMIREINLEAEAIARTLEDDTLLVGSLKHPLSIVKGNTIQEIEKNVISIRKFHDHKQNLTTLAIILDDFNVKFFPKSLYKPPLSAVDTLVADLDLDLLPEIFTIEPNYSILNIIKGKSTIKITYNNLLTLNLADIDSDSINEILVSTADKNTYLKIIAKPNITKIISRIPKPFVGKIGFVLSNFPNFIDKLIKTGNFVTLETISWMKTSKNIKKISSFLFFDKKFLSNKT